MSGPVSDASFQFPSGILPNEQIAMLPENRHRAVVRKTKALIDWLMAYPTNVTYQLLHLACTSCMCFVDGGIFGCGNINCSPRHLSASFLKAPVS